MNLEDAIKKIIEEYGDTPDASDVASFCFEPENYTALTGSEPKVRYQEQCFDKIIDDVYEHFDIDCDDFSEAWYSCSEGSGECWDCGEDIYDCTCGNCEDCGEEEDECTCDDE